MKAAAAIAGLAVIGLLLSAGWIYWVGGPEQLNDGDGALASLGKTGNSVGDAFDPKYGPVWTMGISLCINPGFDRVTLDGTVQGATVVGGGLTFVGAMAGLVNAGETSYLGGGTADGFPPQTGLPLVPAAGFDVTTPCDFGPNAKGPFTELVFGVRWPGGAQGGGWDEIQISYRVHGFHHVLTANWGVYVCGSLMSADLCPNPMPHI